MWQVSHKQGDAFSIVALRAAWEDVLRNDEQDGIPAPGVARFKERVEDNLERLSCDIANGTWRAGHLSPVSITIGEKARLLHVPTVSDRVIARAALAALIPTVEPHLGPGAYAYRAGLGVADAVQAVVALREEGMRWVLRTDIADCFPTLPREGVWAKLQHVFSGHDVLGVVRQLLDRTVCGSRGGVHRLSGVPQGCPLSPMLCNLGLADLDSALLAEGWPVIRYGDDLLVATTSKSDAEAALALASNVVKGMSMELNAEKTRVTTFDDGFTFLGEDFGPRYPPCLPGFRLEDPTERAMYVGHQGSRLRVAAGRLVVESKDDAQLLDVASSQVSRLVLFGSVGLSAGVRTWALNTGIDVVLASRKGNYLGTMLSHEHRYRPARLRAQLTCADSPRGLDIGRAIVRAKVTHQQTLLQRLNRRDGTDTIRDAVAQMDALVAMLPEAGSIQEIMGLEGAAARVYYPAWGRTLPEGMRFTERSRRPPQDVINAALSYLYTLLVGECVTALHAAGLDPAIGLLHTEQDKRPSLALDLMEEFRPWLVDQVIAELAKQRRLRPEHGRSEAGSGVLLTNEGKGVVVDAYERRLLGSVSGAITGFAGTRRRHIYRQAQLLRVAIQEPSATWTGLTWRP